MNVVSFKPIVVPDLRFHVYADLCRGRLGHVSANRELDPWDCGALYYGSKANPPLASAPACEEAHAHFVYQYQNGSVDEGTLTLPAGSGFRVGGKADTAHFLAVGFHFQQKNLSTDGTAVGPGLEVTLIRDPSMRPVFALDLNVFGFVERESIGSVTGSWTLHEDLEVHLLVIYTHWHAMATEALVQVKRTNGHSITLLRQNTHKYWGMTQLSDSYDHMMRAGDRLLLTCTYNNTMASVLKVR